MPNKELIGASTVPILLTVLKEGENYGYELIKKVKEFSGGKLEWSEAMLYPVLHRMERDGLISSSWVSLGNRRKRKYYKITSEGRAVLSAKKEDWLVMIKLFSQIWDLKLAT